MLIYYIEVRYTNYTRLNPDDLPTTLMAERSNIRPEEDANLTTDFHPTNDAERDAYEVQYKRLRHNENISKDRTWETNGLNHIKKPYRGQARILDDRYVIPYNPYLLLKYGCHINIEYVFGQKACKYIFKYLLKGMFLLLTNIFIRF